MTRALRESPTMRAEARALLRKRQGNRCCYCLRAMAPDGVKQTESDAAVTLEHLDERRGLTYEAIGNKAAACYRCNRYRGNLNWLLYASLRRGEFTEALVAFPEHAILIRRWAHRALPSINTQEKPHG